MAHRSDLLRARISICEIITLNRRSMRIIINKHQTKSGNQPPDVTSKAQHIRINQNYAQLPMKDPKDLKQRGFKDRTVLSLFG